MTKYWNDLEGVSIAGRYPLEERLSSSDGDAWYRTRLPDGTPAAMRVTADSPGRLSLWRDAVAARHPHLVRMFDAGREEFESGTLIYAVCEFPDDFLAGVLQERPLSPNETREALRSAVDALRFLHGRGLVHAAVDPTHIMSFGSIIKLPSDTWERPAVGGEARTGPYDSPEGARGNLSPAADVWALAITLHEMLTQQRPNVDSDPQFRYLAEPFATVLRHSLVHNPKERWTVDEIDRHLATAVIPAPAEPAPEPVAEPQPAPAAATVKAAAVPAAEKPATPAKPASLPAPPPPRIERDEPPARPFSIRWVPVAGIVAALGLGVYFLRQPDEPVKATPPAAPPAAAPVRSAPPPPPQVQQRPSPIPARDREVVPASNETAKWRVIAYTYASRAAAEKKVDSLAKKHPDLNPEVFAPKGNRSPFFISLGGRMTHTEAVQLQKRARGKGLPRDTFVRNFSR